MTQQKEPAIEDRDELPLYSERFVDALRVAAIGHATQMRKGTDRAADGTERRPVPYIAHPLGVCAIALEYGADEDEAIAALLHDLIEDTLPTDAARAAVARFGDRVLAIVEDCTDGPEPDGTKKPTAERKAIALERIGGFGRSSLLVSASDKLHNTRAIVANQRTHGDGVWSRFNVGRDAQLAHYGKLVRAFLGNPAHHPELIAQLDRTVAEMHALASAPYASAVQLAASNEGDPP